MDSPGELTAIGVIFTVLGGILTKFFDFLYKRNKDNILADNEKDERLAAAYALTLGKMEIRVTALEEEKEKILNELRESRKDHVLCLQSQAALRADITILETKLKQVQKKQDDSDTWLHDDLIPPRDQK